MGEQGRPLRGARRTCVPLGSGEACGQFELAKRSAFLLSVDNESCKAEC